MAEKKVTSKVDVTVCIPLPQLPKREDTLTTTSHSLVSSDGLWSWTLELEALKPSDEYRKFQLKVLCSAHDQKSPSSKRIISWGGRLECMFRHSSVSKLANIGRYLDTPYEFFTKKYALPYPTEIKFEINLSAIVMQKSSEPKRAPSGVSLLTKSLGSLLESGIMSDVQLCTEGEEIPAHCSILAARSDFFKAMFKPEWNHGVGNSVNVNMSPPILKEMLRYIYTGSLGDSANMTDLLIAADEYLVTDLCNEIKEWLQESLVCDSKTAASVCCDLLKTSATNNSPSLKRVVLEYLKSHRKQVMQSKEWEQFQVDNREVAADAVLEMYNLGD